jgi:hypothetical protein
MLFDNTVEEYPQDVNEKARLGGRQQEQQEKCE